MLLVNRQFPANMGLFVAQPERNRGWWRCCQTNSNQFQLTTECVNLSGTKLPPLGESGASVEFETVSLVEVTFLIEMIVDG